MLVNKRFINAGLYISKSKLCQNAKPSAYSTSSPEQFKQNPLFRLPLIAKRCAGDEVAAYYFYGKTNISLDFHICISVPLTILSEKLERRCSLRFLYARDLCHERVNAD